jgi:hypothetical protein
MRPWCHLLRRGRLDRSLTLQGKIVPSSNPRHHCYQCRHFRNSPEYLESVFKGLTSLSSAHGSVRVEDGICLINGRYLAANRCCERFEAIVPSAKKAAPAAV